MPLIMPLALAWSLEVRDWAGYWFTQFMVMASIDVGSISFGIAR
jgi:hypothetical protein